MSAAAALCAFLLWLCASLSPFLKNENEFHLIKHTSTTRVHFRPSLNHHIVLKAETILDEMAANIVLSPNSLSLGGET